MRKAEFSKDRVKKQSKFRALNMKKKKKKKLRITRSRRKTTGMCFPGSQLQKDFKEEGLLVNWSNATARSHNTQT